MGTGLRTLLVSGALLVTAYVAGLAVLAAVALTTGSGVAWVLLLLAALGLLVVGLAATLGLALAISVRRARRARAEHPTA